MKHKLGKILESAIMLFFGFVSVSTSAAQTDYSVPVTFAVTQTGVNRFLAEQWTGMTKSWSGSYNGLTYSFQLDRPGIVLLPNGIKITLKISIQAPPVFTDTVTLTPTLTIPSTSISASSIIAQYLNLHEVVIGAAQLVDVRLQHVIEEALAPIDWVIYQGQALNASTTRLTTSADIAWKGLPTLTFAVATNEIDFTITPTVTATAPSYTFQWSRSGNRQFGFRITSNNQFSASALLFYSSEENRLTSESYNPVQASFDVSTGKYVAEGYITTVQNVANAGTFYLDIKLDRGGAEPLFVMNFQDLGDYPHAWTSGALVVSNPWEE